MMRVTRLSEKMSLHILIDSGRTHNFLDVVVVKKLGCRPCSFHGRITDVEWVGIKWEEMGESG